MPGTLTRAFTWIDEPTRLEIEPLPDCDEHYFHQTAWAVGRLRKIADTSSGVTDFGGTQGFLASASAFGPVGHYDLRPYSVHTRLSMSADRVECDVADLVHLEKIPSGSRPIVTCLHVIEHVGLGRYGDTLDPEGDLKAASELQRITRSGGWLLVSVPCGRPALVGNSHRIYSREMLGGMFTLPWEDFQMIGLHRIVLWPDAERVSMEAYGCAMIAMRKP
jgi:hypothetical protein